MKAYQVTDEMVLDVEHRVGMGSDAWDVIPPRDIIAASIAAWMRAKEEDGTPKMDFNHDDMTLQIDGAVVGVVHDAGAFPCLDEEDREACDVQQRQLGKRLAASYNAMLHVPAELIDQAAT